MHIVAIMGSGPGCPASATENIGAFGLSPDLLIGVTA
jgi:hypothetical protein